MESMEIKYVWKSSQVYDGTSFKVKPGCEGIIINSEYSYSMIIKCEKGVYCDCI